MRKTWRLQRTRQCAKCPWRTDVDPRDIPNGYSEEKHRSLERTIAVEGDLSVLASGELPVMACHEMHESHCIGWLSNQLGAGNNIALRVAAMSCENISEIETIGEQHARFEDTFPREVRKV